MKQSVRISSDARRRSQAATSIPPNPRAAPVKYQLAILEEIALQIRKPLSQKALAKKKRRHASYYLVELTIDWTQHGLTVGCGSAEAVVINDALKAYGTTYGERLTESSSEFVVHLVDSIRSRFFHSDRRFSEMRVS